MYADKNKVAGVGYTRSFIEISEAIYQRYLQAFKKGVFNYIKEDHDLMTQETIPRKYFSEVATDFGRLVLEQTPYISKAQLANDPGRIFKVPVNVAMVNNQNNGDIGNIKEWENREFSRVVLTRVDPQFDEWVRSEWTRTIFIC